MTCTLSRSIAVLTASIAISISTYSCRRIHIVPGRFEIVSVSDSTTNGDSFITGHVLNMQGSPMNVSSVWIESLNVSVEPDFSGRYSLSIPPGTYLIKCQTIGNRYKELLLEIKDLPAGKNQKTVIDFYLGHIDE